MKTLSMKNTLLAVLITPVMLLKVCGDNPTNNNNYNPPPPATNDSLLYFFDSVSIRTVGNLDTLLTLLPNLNGDSLHLVFTSSTNLTGNDSLNIAVVVVDWTFDFLTGGQLNIKHILDFRVSSSPNLMSVSIINYYQNSFIKLSNIMLFKVLEPLTK